MSVSPLQVIHASPGRIRLRIQDNKLDAAVEHLRQKIADLYTHLDVQTHPTNRSVILQFDPNELSLESLLARLPVKPQTTEEQPPSLSEGLGKASSLLRRAAPLLSGYAAVRLLGVSGWASLPVFLLSDIMTREVLNQVIPPQPAKVDDSLQDLAKSLSSTPERPTNRQQSVQGLQTPALARRANADTIACTLKHSLPGRIRYKIPRLLKDADYTRKLTHLLERDRSVTGIKLNPDSGSLTVYYTAEQIGEAAMQSHLADLIQTAPTVSLPIATTIVEPAAPEAEPSSWNPMTIPMMTLGLSALCSLGLPIPSALVAGSVAIAALPVAQRAWDGLLQERKLNIDFLDLAAITITAFQGNFLNPAIMISLIEFGEAIREQSARSSKRQALDLLSSLENLVWVERHGEKLQILTHDVEHGETVIVYPGEQIPVDGHILTGTALIDEQKLTGEAMPVLRKPGQMAYASTLVREGSLYIRADRLSSETRAGQILKVMEAAPVHDTRIGNYAAEIADLMVIPTLLIAAGAFALTRNLARAASILTLDFATGIRISVPTTVLAALTYAARRGILIRSGRTLEQLAKVDAVVFDKTGTLTQGEPVVVSVETLGDGMSAAEVISMAAAAEQRLTHPVAEAVVRYAKERGARIADRGKWDYQIGRGVRAEIDGQTILVGSRHFMAAEGVDLAALHSKYQALQANGHSVIYVASEGQLRGAIAYRDPLRPESQEVVRSLKRADNMEVHLLTGDNQHTAAAVAHELGIASTHTYAEAFPEQKVAVVNGLHAEGKTVAFVGDGINDSPALAYADVSVSFGNGSDVARETADVVLMENNLRGLPEAIAIARQAMYLIHQNTGLVAVPNLTAMLFAVTTGIPPIAATLVNNGSTIVAGLNGLRPLLTRDEDLNLLADSLEESREARTAWPETEEVADEQPPVLELEEPPSDTLSSDSCESVVELTESPPEPSTQATSNLSLPPIEPVMLEVLSPRTLAERLKVSVTTISRNKSKANFATWSSRHDPDGIAWRYLKKSKEFVPEDPVNLATEVAAIRRKPADAGY
ncbi:heavy metal translocating P-type ATPase [Leptodesmis sp.]|uniref:heavy metal translocating P-type ATPase n=1 Tax=Leptodesmis sp. TaxID=3100501 RepID=UPI0040534F43